MSNVKITHEPPRVSCRFCGGSVIDRRGVGSRHRRALAKEADEGDKSAAWYRFKIGDMEATVVSDGYLGPFPLRDFKAPKEERRRLAKGEFLSPEKFASRKTVWCSTPGTSSPIDTGEGLHRFRQGGGRLLKNLEAAGVKAEDIDAIILTTAISTIWRASSARGASVPQRQIMVSKPEFDFWTDEGKLSATGMMKLLVIAAPISCRTRID